jgi:hypothetical protein
MGNVYEHGKQLLKNKIESGTSSRSFRDPSRIDNRYTHSKIRDISE